MPENKLMKRVQHILSPLQGEEMAAAKDPLCGDGPKAGGPIPGRPARSGEEYPGVPDHLFGVGQGPGHRAQH